MILDESTETLHSTLDQNNIAEDRVKQRMLKKERAEFISKELDLLYPNPPVPLDHFDAYSLLVAVLLSAQCTDKMVNRVTPDLWKLADSPSKMAKKTAEQIRKVIQPCGLSPQKSKAIKNLSQILVQRYESEVPRTIEQLEELPGVGHKTARVVMAQAFDVPSFPVDTHIHRLAQRWKLTDGRSVVQTERDLKKLFIEERWNDLHLQIIFYGREHCTALGCDGTKCTMCRTMFPRRKKPIVTRK